MAHKTLDPQPRHAIESCTIQLHSWRPFHLPNPPNSSDSLNSKPYSNGFHTKRPCLSDRKTTSYQVDAIDMSKLSLFDDDHRTANNKRGSLSLVARKRRRRHGSRSVSGRSSDRSGTRRCCSVGPSAAYATCSDFPVAAGTDSSGELFVNGDPNWSDVSEAKNSRRERDGGGERENIGCGGFGQLGVLDAQGNESGYGSEPGYRGDAEFGYGDEIDEEEDDQRLLFWGEKIGDMDTNMEMVGENTFSEQKAHHRCRRKKNDWRMVGALR